MNSLFILPEEIFGEFLLEFEFDDGNDFECDDECVTLVEGGTACLHVELLRSVVPIYNLNIN